YAVVQLRQDNALGTLFNMVGLQTKLRHGAQADVFRCIPGLENAEFARLGGLHRDTFLDSPRLLDPTLRLNADPRLRFAGQITGCEGYVESAAMGLIAGRFAAAERLGMPADPPPPTTAFGALLNHITGGHILADDEPGKRSFQPMNINFGLFPPVEVPKADNRRLRGKEKALAKKRAITARALADCRRWLGIETRAAAESDTSSRVRAPAPPPILRPEQDDTLQVLQAWCVFGIEIDVRRHQQHPPVVGLQDNPGRAIGVILLREFF